MVDASESGHFAFKPVETRIGGSGGARGGRQVTRVAAVDCGTNSIRLLVADADPETGELVDLDRRMTIVRLGQGVDRTGRLAPEALERTFAACREYAAVIKEHGAERVRFVATSASRDAENRDEFVRGVLDILGVEPEVIIGRPGGRVLLHRRHQGADGRATTSRSPTWSSTSAAARPSSSSATTRCARRAPSTSAAYG